MSARFPGVAARLLFGAGLVLAPAPLLLTAQAALAAESGHTGGSSGHSGGAGSSGESGSEHSGDSSGHSGGSGSSHSGGSGGCSDGGGCSGEEDSGHSGGKKGSSKGGHGGAGDHARGGPSHGVEGHVFNLPEPEPEASGDDQKHGGESAGQPHP